MCGIAGAIHLEGGFIDSDEVVRMVQALSHRGPDASVTERITSSIVFGHTRLAIFDLSERANQPMEHNGCVLTYNGEVYNFRKIARLFLDAANLSTSSDTEVVLKILVEKGIVALQEFDGFFAFAFFDGTDVYLVRDRFGQKPLYYTQVDDILYFASEIKALPLDKINLTVSEEVAAYVDRYRFSPSLSPFSEVNMLPAGHFLKIEMHSRTLLQEKYYDVCSHIVPQGKKVASQLLLKKTEELFLKAVEKRLVADVPVGVLCSGGLDSSLLAWAARQYGPVELFHVSVSGNSEQGYAELVADTLDCNLQVVEWNKEQFVETSRDALCAFEYANVHPNNTALLAAAKLASDCGVKVLLGGEGADELYGGYVHHYRYYRLNQVARWLSPAVSKFISGSRTPAARWKQHTGGTVRDIEAKIESDVSTLMGCYDGYENARYLGFLLSDFLSYLQPLLLRGDKMSMVHGVELRLPFMDQAFVEWSLGLPAQYRVKKSLLKVMAGGRLPAMIVDRAKEGFSFPRYYFQSSGQCSSEQERIRRSLNELREIFSERNGENVTYNHRS